MKIYQFHIGEINSLNRQCMSILGNQIQGIEYELVTEPPRNEVKNEDYRAASDVKRIELAIDNPECFWLDCDVVLTKRGFPESPLNGKPYFVKCGNRIDAWAFYANGCKQFFEETLEHYKSCDGKPFWLQKYLQTRISEINTFPESYFIHCLGHLAKQGAKGWGNNLFGVSLLENGDYELRIA